MQRCGAERLPGTVGHGGGARGRANLGSLRPGKHKSEELGEGASTETNRFPVCCGSQRVPPLSWTVEREQESG